MEWNGITLIYFHRFRGMNRISFYRRRPTSSPQDPLKRVQFTPIVKNAPGGGVNGMEWNASYKIARCRGYNICNTVLEAGKGERLIRQKDLFRFIPFRWCLVGWCDGSSRAQRQEFSRPSLHEQIICCCYCWFSIPMDRFSNIQISRWRLPGKVHHLKQASKRAGSFEMDRAVIAPYQAQKPLEMKDRQ